MLCQPPEAVAAAGIMQGHFQPRAVAAVAVLVVMVAVRVRQVFLGKGLLAVLAVVLIRRTARPVVVVGQVRLDLPVVLAIRGLALEWVGRARHQALPDRPSRGRAAAAVVPYQPLLQPIRWLEAAVVVARLVLQLQRRGLQIPGLVVVDRIQGRRVTVALGLLLWRFRGYRWLTTLRSTPTIS